MWKLLKILLYSVGAVILALALLTAWLSQRSYTPAIQGPDPIALLTTVEVDDDRQALLVRGADRSNPILFFLHGGPGMPMMYLGHAFQRPLESDFVVVHWDQRGAGKSFRDDQPERMRISQLLSDAEVVIEHILRELGQREVILVGHSHGSYLGVLLSRSRPDLVRAYVGVGQATDDAEARRIQFETLSALYPDVEVTGANRESLLFDAQFELYGSRSMLPLIWDGVLASEYSLRDIMNVAKGPQFSGRHMQYDVIDGPVSSEITELEVPVYFIMGARDLVTPTSLARAYFEAISAPEKAFFIFDRSAHFPHYEEPDHFAETMRELFVLP